MNEANLFETDDEIADRCANIRTRCRELREKLSPEDLKTWQRFSISGFPRSDKMDTLPADLRTLVELTRELITLQSSDQFPFPA